MSRVGVNVQDLAIVLPDLQQALRDLASDAADGRDFVRAARQHLQALAAQSGQRVQVSFRLDGTDYQLCCGPDAPGSSSAPVGLDTLLQLARQHEDDGAFRDAVCRWAETRGHVLSPADVDSLMRQIGAGYADRQEMWSAVFELSRVDGSARGTLASIPLCRAVAERLVDMAYGPLPRI